MRQSRLQQKKPMETAGSQGKGFDLLVESAEWCIGISGLPVRKLNIWVNAEQPVPLVAGDFQKVRPLARVQASVTISSTATPLSQWAQAPHNDAAMQCWDSLK